VNPAYIALAFTVLVNVLALVWGAATLSSSVKSLALSVTDLHNVCERMDTRGQRHEVRISVIESELQIKPLNRRSEDHSS
jgi:hypothetical protein